MNIHQNIFLPMLATKHSKIRLSDKKLYINELMIRAGIYDLKNKYPSQISGGEAQRVALVRALVNKPSILLADEPTGSLDAKNAESMGELLLEMNKEYSMTLILATHSIDIANKMSKKLHLVDGKLISE
jgi:ABC-type lipoprotein export system ATPase subunit